MDPRRSNAGTLAAVASLCFAAIAGLQPLRSFDLFWHLACGRWIVEHRALPAIDPFRFTSDGAPWIDHSWLAQLGLFAVERTLGLNGLAALGALAAVVIAALLIHGVRASGASAPVAALLASLAIFGARPRLMVRPELASLVGLAVLLVWLQGYRSQPSWPRVMLMAFAVALWANLHPGVILAPVVALVYLTGCRIACAGAIGRREIAGVPLVFAAATLATPAGLALWAVPFRIRAALEGLPVVNPEWLPAWAGPWQMLACGGAALVLLFCVPAARRRRLDPPTALVAALLAAAAVASIRNQGIFFIAAAFAAGAVARPGKRLAAGFAIATAVVLAAWCIRPPETGILRARQARVRVGAGLEPGLFPEQAAQLLAARAGIGPLYNDVAFGGYLLWRLYPERKVFLDGRNEVDSAFLREVALARAREDAWTALLDKNAIDAALVQYRPDRWKVVRPDSGYLTIFEYRTASQVHFPAQRFALIQWDDAGMLFVRRTSARAAELAAEEFRVVRPEDPEGTLTAARSSREVYGEVVAELDRHDRRFGACERSAWIRAALQRAAAPPAVAPVPG